MWKRSLFRHPLEISLGENSNTVARFMHNAKKIVKLNMSIYNYRMNPNSMIQKKDKNLFDLKKSINILEEYFKRKHDKFLISIK